MSQDCQLPGLKKDFAGPIANKYSMYRKCSHSVAEGFLLTICISASTMRRFFWSVALGLFSRHPESCSACFVQGLVTIGGSGAPRQTHI